MINENRNMGVAGAHSNDVVAELKDFGFPVIQFADPTELCNSSYNMFIYKLTYVKVAS